MSDEEVSEGKDTDSQRRLRTLTEKAQANFDEEYQRRSDRIRNAYENLSNLLDKIPTCESAEELKSLEQSINKSAAGYEELSNTLLNYCERTHTVASLDSARSQRITLQGCNLIVGTAIRRIRNRIDEINAETSSSVSRNSRTSKSSRSSKMSDISSEIARSKAKAEAAKAKLKYVKLAAEMKRKQNLLDEQQARVNREKADLSTELEVIEATQEAAAALAETEALENFDESKSVSDKSVKSLHDVQLPQANPTERTNEYVEEISKALSHCSFENKVDSRDKNDNDEIKVLENDHLESNLNPTATPYFPRMTTASDFTKYLLKKDLLLTRLCAFDDRPETFFSWKQSFQNVMDELAVSPHEELDLLVKYSGPESRKHIVSIKSSNISNPSQGVERAWNRLQERYGYPEMMELSIKKRIQNFPKISVKDTQKLYDLHDLASEIDALKSDTSMAPFLSHYDSSIGVTPLVNKLPHNLQEKWTNSAVRYMKVNEVSYPKFGYFVDFLREQSRIRNNPSFFYENANLGKDTHTSKFNKGLEKNNIHVRKTETNADNNNSKVKNLCPLHLTEHSLNKCRAFKAKPIEERRKFLKEKKICFKCCDSTSHIKRDCDKDVQCFFCHNNDHPTALHVDKLNFESSTPQNRKSTPQPVNNQSLKSSSILTPQGGENNVNTSCTRICGPYLGRSCAKIILANAYLKHDPDNVIRLYVMLDDQSNRTLARSRLFNELHGNYVETEYVLTSCSGRVNTLGRKMNNLVIESLDRSTKLEIPSVIECNSLPENRSEIPTPIVAQSYTHLRDVAHLIPEIENEVPILMLIGRDVITAHHVIDHRIGPSDTPYGQKLALGWTIIGESCLGKVHASEDMSVFKTSVLVDGRSTLFEPCESHHNISEKLPILKNSFSEFEDLHQNVFLKTKEDDKPGLSIDDRSFIDKVSASFHKDESDEKWSCALPFRDNRPSLRNNREQVLRRAYNLDKSLKKDEVKRKHFLEFMQGMLAKGHAEKAPPLRKDEEAWYLPIFGVYHQRKRDKLRIVFDSAAKFDGICLNDVLLSGPDLTNNLLGILLRFRREHVAVLADIEQMFYGFKVDKEHRNYLRFFWHENNDISEPLVEYRMCVHIFGSTSSPAIATYGLRLMANQANDDVKNFVSNDFYVDDGLTSQQSVKEAISLVERTQNVLLNEGKLRLHKIASNRKEVMEAFPPDDLAKGLEHFPSDPLPVQHSLGVKWNLETDTFIIDIQTSDKPFSRRGILSTINSIFDPLGFLAPIVLEGKLFLRNLISRSSDWDEPIPDEYLNIWNRWTSSLSNLSNLHIPRTYLKGSFAQSQQKTVHIFCDASESAISSVALLRSQNDNRDVELGFLLGKSKVAPAHGHTIPRLELCSAVLSTEIAEIVSNHLDLPVSEFHFYSDSKIVLGYINNQSRRFFNYVANRVQKIRSISKPSQWHYVNTESNPADEGTRTLPASELSTSPWLLGPKFLLSTLDDVTEAIELQNPDSDKEIRKELQACKTETSETYNSFSGKFCRFSDWKHLVNTIARLKHIAKSFSNSSKCVGWHLCGESKSPINFMEAKLQIIKLVQRDVFKDELSCLEKGIQVKKSSYISSLSPYLDDEGLLRVGGRIRHANIPEEEAHPILIPGRHHIAVLLVRQYHELTHHAGRHITHGAIRSAGFWITGGKSLVSSVLHRCVVCRKLRGSLCSQKMADLPQDRLAPGPPFTSVGVDCFGPWHVSARRTRGGLAYNKRWAVLFTCLTTRGVHIETVEEMSTSSFIMAMKRFIAIRGPVSHFRSDRGTNFVGSTKPLGITAINVEDGKLRDYFNKTGCTWEFNPPYASHMGGVWERAIGMTRRILDSLLLDVPGQGLTHEMLVTFLAEVTAIINSRPLVLLDSDSENPIPLSPSMLLTQKPQQIVEVPANCLNDMHIKQWKRVQMLAERFWKRWRNEFLQSLQMRQKWTKTRRNLSVGDTVLVRDTQLPRNSWPVGIVTRVHHGTDGLVRSCELRVIKDGVRSCTRPVTELVLLIPEN